MQPSSHKESESERKAKSRLQRHSRRSTQGVTLEHVGEAARQIQGSASSSSIEDNEQKNLLQRKNNLEYNTVRFFIFFYYKNKNFMFFLKKNILCKVFFIYKLIF